MPRRPREAGEGALKTIFWLAVLGALIMFCVKFVPVKIASAEFADYMSEQAKFAQGASEDALRRRILEKARALRLPISAENCTVVKPGDRIRMECKYSIEVDYIVTKYVYHFNPQVDEAFFIF